MSAFDSAPTRPAPGELLRRRREACGWSLAEVAQSLRLSIPRLEALENDEYDKLPGETYIRGYWKNYAQLLGISIDDSIAWHRGAMRGCGAVAAARAQNSRGYFRRPAAYLAALAAFGCAVWLWYGEPTPASRAADAPLAAVPPLQELEAWAARLPAEIGPLTAAAGGIAAVAPATELAAAESSRAPTVAAAAGHANAFAAADSYAELAFAVAQPSWIEVRDAVGARLIHGRIASGKRVVARGQPPYAVFIGNAAGVAVEYNGEKLRIKNRGRIFARFQVGARELDPR